MQISCKLRCVTLVYNAMFLVKIIECAFVRIEYICGFGCYECCILLQHVGNVVFDLNNMGRRNLHFFCLTFVWWVSCFFYLV
jgi:hypothetical protein